jgi:replicative DNA helicase
MKTLPVVIEEIEQAKDNLEFIPTGFKLVDRHLDGGMMRKELVVLGAPSGLGKSNVACQIFLNVAQKGFKSAYFSLEISNEMTVCRMIGALANLKPTRIMAGLLTPEEFERKTEAKERLLAFADYMSFYDHLYTLDEITKEIKENKYEFVVIDFIQNIVSKGKDEYDRLSRAAIDLQKLAKETNSCIMVLSQLSNQVAREGDKAPNVEYRGSGSIAMVCDLGFFIQREKAVAMDAVLNKLSLMLRKNRRGIAGVGFELIFLHPGGYIYDFTDKAQPDIVAKID